MNFASFAYIFHSWSLSLLLSIGIVRYFLKTKPFERQVTDVSFHPQILQLVSDKNKNVLIQRNGSTLVTLSVIILTLT